MRFSSELRDFLLTVSPDELSVLYVSSDRSQVSMEAYTAGKQFIHRYSYINDIHRPSDDPYNSS